MFISAGITGTEPGISPSFSTLSSDLPQKPFFQTIDVSLLGTLCCIQIFSHVSLECRMPVTSNGSIVITSSEVVGGKAQGEAYINE
jgi:hypothetical protein